MKANLIAAMAVLTVTTVTQAAVGFFAPQTDVAPAVPNKIGRMCQLTIVWSAGSPSVTAEALDQQKSGSSMPNCENEKAAAMSSALNDMLNPAQNVGL